MGVVWDADICRSGAFWKKESDADIFHRNSGRHSYFKFRKEHIAGRNRLVRRVHAVRDEEHDCGSRCSFLLCLPKADAGIADHGDYGDDLSRLCRLYRCGCVVWNGCRNLSRGADNPLRDQGRDLSGRERVSAGTLLSACNHYDVGVGGRNLQGDLFKRHPAGRNRQSVLDEEVGQARGDSHDNGVRLYHGGLCESRAAAWIFEGILSLFVLGNVVDQFFGILPAETGVCDGFSVDTAAYLLVSFLDIALDHNALDQLMDVGV